MAVFYHKSESNLKYLGNIIFFPGVFRRYNLGPILF